MNYPRPDEGIAFGVPGRPVRPFEQGLGLGVGQDRLADGVPAQLPAQAERQVRQVASGGDTVRTLQVRDRVAARLDAVEEVAGVTLELVELVTGTVFDNPGRACRQLALARRGRPADRVGTAEPGNHFVRGDLGVGRHDEALARDLQAPPRPAELEPRRRGRAAAALPVRPRGGPARVFEQSVLRVGRLAVVLQGEPSAGAGDGRRGRGIQEPVHDVERVLPEVGHLPAGIIPEPPEVVDRPVGVVRPLGGGAEPHVVIKSRRRLAVGGRAEAGHDVAVVPHPDRDDLADPAAADQLASFLVVRPGALLGADLNDPVVPPGDVDHPPPLARKERERLLDIHVLARRTGHHGHQGVPVVGRRDDHRVNVVVVEQGPEVGVSAGGAARECDGLVAPAAVDLGDGHDPGVGLIPEVEDVPLADQAETDETQADPVVGPQDPPVRRGGEGRGGPAAEQRSPAQNAPDVGGVGHCRELPPG